MLAELGRTLALGRPRPGASSAGIDALQSVVERLDRHADVLNTPIEPAGVTPFQVIGRLARLYAEGIEATDLPLPGSETWDPAQYRERVRTLDDLRDYLQATGPPADHPWRGVNRTDPILPADQKALQSAVAEAARALTAALAASETLLDALELPGHQAPTLRDIQQLTQFAQRLTKAPALDRSAIASPVWGTRRDAIASLVTEGQALARARSGLQGSLTDQAWKTELEPARLALAARGPPGSAGSTATIAAPSRPSAASPGATSPPRCPPGWNSSTP